MDFQSMMETFAEAWVAANVQTPLTEAAEQMMAGNTSSGISVTGRSTIPIHCVVERISSPGSNTSNSGGVGSAASSDGDSGQPSVTPAIATSLGTTSSATVESNPSSICQSAVVEQDSYAIIASGVLFMDLVRTALLKLGYSTPETIGAKGVIQLRNWKPLTFDQISDSTDATVGDILGDISTVATLRIRLYRPRMNAAHELKDKLLQVLLAHSYSQLANSGCPIDQQILSGLCRGRAEQEITDDTRRRFDQWYLQQVFNHYRQIAIAAQQPPTHQSGSRPTPTHPLLIDLNQSNGEHLHPNIGNNSSNHSTDKHPALIPMASPSNNQQQHQHMTSVRTRIRTSFDPELELPKLHRWFQENRHPSRTQVQEYVRELNALESRKGRKPLDINNVVYWFKNARAAHKRAELKFVGDSSTNDGLINGNTSPGKTGSDTSGKCNEDSQRNGSAIDDFYSMDEDGDSSHEATQTLDLSMRPSKKARSESPLDGDYIITAHKHDDDIQSDVNNSVNNNIPDLKVEPNDGSSDCSDGDDSDEEKEYFDNLTTFPNISHINNNNNNNNSNNNSTLPESPDGRRIRRSRTFIDPMSEVPRLEHWFSINTHPAHSQIVRYTDELNNLAYRQKFPKLEPKNIQFWFKNRRAKFKRNLSVPTTHHSSQSSALNIERLINAH